MTQPPRKPGSWEGFLTGINKLAEPDKKKTPKKKPSGIVLGDVKYVPPEKKTGPPSTNIAIDKLLKKYPQWRKYLPGITNAAAEFGANAVDMLKVLIVENEGADPGSVSGRGARGLAQIWDPTVNKSLNPEQYEQLVRETGTLTRNFADDAAKSFKYLAWRMAGTIVKDYGGDVNAWYKGNYNPGDTSGRTPDLISKRAGIVRYQPGYDQTPAQKAADSYTTEQQKLLLTDPYVRGFDGKGGITTTTNPKSALTYNGAPMPRSVFLATKRSVEDYFVSYTGGRPSNQQVANYIKNGWSEYQLSVALSHGPNFTKSPIYKQKAGAYKAVAEPLLGVKEKGVNPDVMREAIVNQWSEATLQQNLREREQYVHSAEFTGKTATFGNVYTSIMGKPGPNATGAIAEAALGGWTPDQFAAWIRSRPSYAYSPEYQAKSLDFLGALGLITGDQAVLKKGIKPGKITTQPGGGQKLPNDPRLKTPDKIASPSPLVATLQK